MVKEFQAKAWMRACSACPNLRVAGNVEEGVRCPGSDVVAGGRAGARDCEGAARMRGYLDDGRIGRHRGLVRNRCLRVSMAGGSGLRLIRPDVRLSMCRIQKGERFKASGSAAVESGYGHVGERDKAVTYAYR